MSVITLVTGFFDIHRGEWKKYNRSSDDYMDYFSKWCGIKNKMVVYVENKEFEEKIYKLREQYGLREQTIVKIVSNYTSIEKGLFKRIEEQTSNKIQHAFRMQPLNPEVVNPYYDYVMLLKEWCVCDAIENKLADGLIAWMDFGFNHGGETVDSNGFINFKWEYDFPEKISFFTNREINRNRPIFDVVRTMDVYIMGTVIVAPDYLWLKLWSYVKDAMYSLCDCGLVDDDQTILLMVYKNHTEECCTFPSSWNMQLIDYSNNNSVLKPLPKAQKKPATLKIILKKWKRNIQCIRYALRQYHVIMLKSIDNESNR